VKHGSQHSKRPPAKQVAFPKPKVFKGIAFELIFFEILYTTSKGGGLLLAVNLENIPS